MNTVIVIYFRCGFIIEPAIHYHKMRARKWANRLLLLIITHLSFPCQKQRVGKMGNEWGKNPQKNEDSVPDNFHFPQETVLFHPEFWISLLLQIHSQTYKRAWLPQKKAQKLEKWNRYSPQNRSFLEVTFLFQVIRKIDDYVNRLIISLLEESRLKNLPDSKSSNYFFCISLLPLFLYIFIYVIYIIN